MPEEFKQCRLCKESKPVSKFYRQKRNRDGLRHECAKCLNRMCYEAEKKRPEALKERRKRSRMAADAKNPDRGFVARIKHIYGITEHQYEAMVQAQGGKCKICNGKEKQRLSIDHCHNTGTVRGLLCKKCNSAIGLLDDNVAMLQRAINYIESGGTNAG